MRRRYATQAALDKLAAGLSERDLAVLRSVSALRFVSGGQLQRMHFADADKASQTRTARRALMRLVGLDLLARLSRRVGGVRAGSAGYVYCLGLAGQRLAEDRGWQIVRTRRRSQSPGLLFLDHALAVAELHTAILEANRAGELELLALDAEPTCWRGYAGVGVLKPDSFVRFGIGAYEYSVFIEVDRGTEGSRALLTKLGQYVAHHRSGVEQAEHGVFPRVLWVVPDESRAAVLRDCFNRLPPTDREPFEVVVFSAAMAVLTRGET